MFSSAQALVLWNGWRWLYVCEWIPPNCCLRKCVDLAKSAAGEWEGRSRPSLPQENCRWTPTHTHKRRKAAVQICLVTSLLVASEPVSLASSSPLDRCSMSLSTVMQEGEREPWLTACSPFKMLDPLTPAYWVGVCKRSTGGLILLLLSDLRPKRTGKTKNRTTRKRIILILMKAIVIDHVALLWWWWWRLY